MTVPTGVESRLVSRIRTLAQWSALVKIPFNSHTLWSEITETRVDFLINFPQFPFPFPFPFLISIKYPFSFLAELSLHRLSFRAWPWFNRILLSTSIRPCPGRRGEYHSICLRQYMSICGIGSIRLGTRQQSTSFAIHSAKDNQQ